MFKSKNYNNISIEISGLSDQGAIFFTFEWFEILESYAKTGL